MTLKLRFAPSPTGLLHVGNARTALVNWLYARQNQGVFILRMDDTDLERAKPEFEHAIRDDLSWLGLTWDEDFRQRDRLDLYERAVQTLKSTGRLYACYESPEELAFKRKTQLNRREPPLYDRGALKLTDADKKQYEKKGIRPHWRFHLKDQKIHWQDLVRGSVEFQGGHLSDPVLIREDGSPIYTLSSVVDDIDSGITHVIRGEDHVANTAVQLQLIEALGKNPGKFTFAHLPLLTGSAGENLSKRLGSLSVKQIRSQGIEAMALNSFLAKLGTSDPLTPTLTLEELGKTFDITHFSRSSPKFLQNDLHLFNEKLVHEMPFEQVKERLPEIDEDFWLLVRENITTLKEVAQWDALCKGGVSPVIQDSEFLQVAWKTLPPEPWNEDLFKAWTNTLKTQTGRKGKDLFMPLRLALTGLEHGPSLKGLLMRIGYEKALKRLQGEKA